jgi:hypothetical protein
MGRLRRDREGRKPEGPGPGTKEGGNSNRSARADPHGASDCPGPGHLGGRSRRARGGPVPGTASAEPGGRATGSDFPSPRLARGGGSSRASATPWLLAAAGAPRTARPRLDGSVRAVGLDGKWRPARGPVCCTAASAARSRSAPGGSAGNQANLMVGCRVQQTCTAHAEQAAEVVRNGKGGTGLGLGMPGPKVPREVVTLPRRIGPSGPGRRSGTCLPRQAPRSVGDDGAPGVDARSGCRRRGNL